ncbi:MAG: AbrB/MazE/SpoVT family DNA-binding domain-containing protein, partial [Pedobacter sp.]
VRTKLGDGGRIIIPSGFRQNLHLNAGDDIIIHMQDNMIYITTPSQALQTLQARVKEHLDVSKKSISLIDELIAMRRFESEHE